MTVSRYFGSIVMGTVVIVTGRYDLASFHHDGTQGETHRALRGGLCTLSQVILRLVHFDFGNRCIWVLVEYK